MAVHTAQFVYDLVGNPVDRFSGAHYIIYQTNPGNNDGKEQMKIEQSQPFMTGLIAKVA